MRLRRDFCCANTQYPLHTAINETRPGSAVTAVVRAVELLEDDPLYDAGLGSKIQSDGKIRMSASLMDGRRLRFSGCVNVERVRNPADRSSQRRRYVDGPGGPRLRYVQQIISNEIADFLSRSEGAPLSTVNLVVRILFNPNITTAWFTSVMGIINNVTMLAIILAGAAVVREREHGTMDHFLDRGREGLWPSPPSEPYGRLSRIRLSSR